ncbi:MAG: hypothetical protein CMN78_03345 [Spirochaetales bacterium]|nr:hypothetical protein [Spirochaetales bacterium]
MSEQSQPLHKTNVRALQIVAAAIALLIPMVVRQYLQADIGAFALFIIVGFVAGSGIAYRVKGHQFPWLKYVSAFLAFALAVTTLVGILITPLSAYIFWFESFKSRIPEGGVANIFVLLITFFSSVLSPLAFSMGIFWPIIIIAFVIVYLLAIIIQTPVFLILLLFLLAFASVYYMVRTTRGKSRQGALFFAVFLIMATYVAVSFFPRMNNPPGNNIINKKIYPNLRKAVVASFPKFPLLYTIPGYGISFDEKKLGARPTLINSPLFEVEGEPGDVIYLKTRVFDTYNGSSWSMSPYIPDQDADRLILNNFFAVDERPQGEAITIRTRARSFAYIPFTVDTQTIYFSGSLPDLKSGNSATGFELARPFKNGTAMQLERGITGPVLDLAGSIRSLYLQIPDDLPSELNVIAEGLRRDLDNKEEMLGRIEAFLAQNYSYNLEAEYFTPDEGLDFVYSFLFQDEGGYCVQFATSFIILARLNGIPARYATGYLSYIPPDNPVGEVTGLSAHAWPEVWLEDKGWVNWEATPAANIANYSTFGNEWFFNLGIDLNASTTRQLEGLLGRSITEQADGVVEDSTGGADALKIMLIVLAALGVIAAGYAGLHFAYPRIRYITDDRGEFYFKARRIARRLERHGVSDPKRVGWVTWTKELKTRIGSDGKQIDNMRDILLRLTYGRMPFSSDFSEALDGFKKFVVKNVIRRRE